MSASEIDVLVIGAGHAGVEAAWAAARLGCSVGVCTLSADSVHTPTLQPTRAAAHAASTPAWPAPITSTSSSLALMP